MVNQSTFETISPWADADPLPLRGLTPRLSVLAGKKIGLLRNNKRAAEPILNAASTRLKDRYPDIEFSWFRGNAFSVSELEKSRLQEFEKWIRSVDAVIAAVGD